jgi:hypothetical protein
MRLFRIDMMFSPLLDPVLVAAMAAAALCRLDVMHMI